MIRIFLFLLTNFSIIILLFILSALFGLHNRSLLYIICSTIITGFTGSIISLLLSKKIALFTVGGKIITEPKNELEEWVLKIIKKQSLRLNISNPEFAIYDSESVNAFATGYSKNSSLIAISSMLLKNMNKKEIEAIIAHEMSHISNGDMVTMTLIQGVLNTFTIFLSRGIAYIICNIFLKSDTTSNKNKTDYVILTFILELIFGIAASCITMWFSRKREFYADASAAKLSSTKNMISALKSLQNYTDLSNEPKNVHALCINGKINSFLDLFSTHPPINVRIQALNKKKYM
ncbi:protease HtpX [Buchnera aphidicola]|uniref:protease HtpX n=1 Tax=Buchnera aphidicola TaxID=9 RepID=UPI002543A869|nr:protease HtpX [Buchnera aphidicola]WII23500.1 protease HtpX [Buchnera aphidicola (Sipha maydis)]